MLAAARRGRPALRAGHGHGGDAGRGDAGWGEAGASPPLDDDDDDLGRGGGGGGGPDSPPGYPAEETEDAMDDRMVLEALSSLVRLPAEGGGGAHSPAQAEG